MRLGRRLWQGLSATSQSNLWRVRSIPSHSCYSILHGWGWRHLVQHRGGDVCHLVWSEVGHVGSIGMGWGGS